MTPTWYKRRYMWLQQRSHSPWSPPWSVTVNFVGLHHTCLGTQMSGHVGCLDISVPSVLPRILCQYNWFWRRTSLTKLNVHMPSTFLYLFWQNSFRQIFSNRQCLGAQTARQVGWLNISVPSVLALTLSQQKGRNDGVAVVMYDGLTVYS